ncbi:MAG: riboflavin synthase [Deltaproteobacteria bacterium CG07_land_8_20_14_0_80_60_11]|nr:MAG: riboflavin synthase [Deltaproteobacteria bacterium CG07_land_8_20_14_0_80_60_11]
MFTGLVEGIGEIVGLTPMAEGLRLVVKTSFPAAELTLGESVAIAGACLTVVALAPPRASFEVSPETLAGTTFPLKKVGDRVNLERAVRLGDRLGGHLVTGHVDGVGVVRELRPGPAHIQMKFELPAALSRFVIEKGSIAVDGVSLTVNICQGHTFTVNVIPHTARETTLAALKVGGRVNLETDIIGKYVARLLGREAPAGEGVTPELLARHGFL